MEVYLFILALTIIFIYMFKHFRRNSTETNGKTLPGPKPWPVLGNALQVDTQHLHQSLSEMVKDFGAFFQLNLLGQKTVVINDPELLRKAFGGKEFSKSLNDRPASFVGKYVLFDNSDIAFCNNTNITMDLRKAVKRIMETYRHGNGQEQFEDKMQEETKRLLDDLDKTNRLDFDIYRVLGKSVANTMFIFLTGTFPEEQDYDKIWQLTQFTDMAFEEMNMFVYDLIPIVRFFPGRFGRIFRFGIKARDTILDRCYFSRKITATEGQSGFVNALTKLLSETDAEHKEEGIGQKHIHGTILDIIIGSVPSYTTVLTNTFALLMVHQHIAKKIQNEIDSNVDRGRLPGFSDREKLPYTVATVYESLRYTSGTGPLGFPHAANTDVVFEGYNIEKGSVLLGNLWYIHHDPKLWDDPWIFKPERFLDAEGKLLPPEHKIYRNFVAFGVGRRNCIGEVLTKSRLFQVIASVFHSYDITLGSEGVFPDVNPRNYLPGGELRVKDFLCRALPRK